MASGPFPGAYCNWCCGLRQRFREPGDEVSCWPSLPWHILALWLCIATCRMAAEARGPVLLSANTSVRIPVLALRQIAVVEPTRSFEANRVLHLLWCLYCVFDRWGPGASLNSTPGWQAVSSIAAILKAFGSCMRLLPQD